MLNLPTDNLYKFLAISGLVIAMFSVYYLFQKSHELQFLIVEQKAELELQKYQMGRYDEKFKLQEEQLSTEETSEKKRSVLDNIDKDLIEYAKVQTNSELNLAKIKILHHEYIYYKVTGIIGFIFGLFLIVFGFVLWYKKIQKPLDYQSAQALAQAKERERQWYLQTPP